MRRPKRLVQSISGIRNLPGKCLPGVWIEQEKLGAYKEPYGDMFIFIHRLGLERSHKLNSLRKTLGGHLNIGLITRSVRRKNLVNALN